MSSHVRRIDCMVSLFVISSLHGIKIVKYYDFLVKYIVSEEIWHLRKVDHEIL